MSDFSTITGDLSYSITLKPKDALGSFGFGLSREAESDLGFENSILRQTGSRTGYGANSVGMADGIVFLANPKQNTVNIYTNVSGISTPVLEETHYITGTGNILPSQAQFGYSIANTESYLVVGAPFYYDNQTSGGKAYIFTRTNTYGEGFSGFNSWGLSSAITGKKIPKSEFGKSVDALSTPSTTLIAVGAPWQNQGDGAAYIFYAGGEFQTTLSPPTAQSGHYGENVKLIRSEELFDELGVAEYSDTTTGEVHIYQSTKDSATIPYRWGVNQTLTSPGGTSGDFFGSSIASDDANLIVASPREDNNKGRVYAYKFNESSNLWYIDQTIQPTYILEDQKFGKSIGFNGTTLGIGSNFNSGCVHLYEPNSAGKFQEIKLLSGDPPIPSGAFGGNETGAKGIVLHNDLLTVGTSEWTTFYLYETGSGALSPAYECFSISGISGKIIDTDNNYVFGYRSGEKITISGNVFSTYHNYYIDDVLVNSNCSRYEGLGNTGAINSFTLAGTGDLNLWTIRVNGKD